MKKAFTLVELLIVIVIIGAVYNLAISNFHKLSSKKTTLSLLNLREYLSSIPHAKSVKLLCLDECQECDIYVDGSKNRALKGFLDESVISYRYEVVYGFVEKEKEVFFDSDNREKNVCFSYEVDVKGVGDQVLVEFKDSFYDLSAYIEKTPVYSSIDEARQARENLNIEVMR